MNLNLDQVVTDITGATGLKIIDAILAGEQDGYQLAALRDRRCQKSEAEIAQALRRSLSTRAPVCALTGQGTLRVLPTATQGL